MSLPNGAGGYQLGDGNLGEVNFFVQGAPASIPAGAATLTTDQLATGIVLGNPGSSAAAWLVSGSVARTRGNCKLGNHLSSIIFLSIHRKGYFLLPSLQLLETQPQTPSRSRLIRA